MSDIIGINPDYDYMFDPQQAEPQGWCPVCGDAELCRRCQEEMEHE